MTTKKENINVNETIRAFVEIKLPAPILLSNAEIHTSGIDDMRLDALREKGIKSFTGGGTVKVHYTDGKSVSVNGALALAALLAGVTVTNLSESLGAGKFASRGKQIILPDDQVAAINTARVEQHTKNIDDTAAKLSAYMQSAGIEFNPADLPLYWLLFTNNCVAGADSSGIWISTPSDKLNLEGLISVECIKGRVSYEHRVQLETTPIVA